MKVHADILRMAKTQEQRERIKWFHARSVFFSDVANAFADGLALARHSSHEDARFLVSLFPNHPPANDEEAVAVFLAHERDARCQYWAAKCSAQPRKQLVRRAAEGGCAWAQAWLALLEPNKDEKMVWLDKALAQGEPEAMTNLALLLWDGYIVPRNRAESERLWREAAVLGHAAAQFKLAAECCDNDPREQVLWMCRSVTQGLQWGNRVLAEAAVGHVAAMEQGEKERGWAVFEIGAALAASSGWWQAETSEGGVAAGEKAMRLHRQWSEEARRAVEWWMRLAKERRVARDVRLLIADLVWEGRRSWGTPLLSP